MRVLATRRAVGHVAVLALYALARVATRLPLVVGGLEQLTVEREPVGFELVTAPAELGLEKSGGARHTVVGHRCARRGARQRAVAPRRAEALVASHVAARARHALPGERRVVVRVLPELATHRDKRTLLGERSVAHEAPVSRRRVALTHLDELARNAGSARCGVQALAPVGELRGMT